MCQWCGGSGCQYCGYPSLGTSNYTSPTVAQFQAQFIRDFPYGTDINTCVTPQDILNAINQADLNINANLWPNQTAYTMGFNLLAAHFLVLTLRASSQGLNGQANFAQNSKSVGPVSESFTIPQRIIDNPLFMSYSKTNYGMQYLNMLWPYLSGQMFSVCGATKP